MTGNTGNKKYIVTAEDRLWRRRRFGWYGCQLILFVAIVYRVGPNLFLFHSPWSPEPKDFVVYTNDFAPMIAEIKAYRRDFGELPITGMSMPPEYIPPHYGGIEGEILNTTSITFPVEEHSVLEYEFDPAKEGWKIHSPRYDGRLDAPIVPAAPKPVSRPSSSG